MGKSKVMRCSRHVNVGRMDKRLNGKTLAEVDYSKYLGLQLVADGRYEMDVVHRISEEYKSWGMLKVCRAIKDWI